MHVRLDRFTDEDLADMVKVYDQLAGRHDLAEHWHAWAREIADAIRVEQAQRMIAAAQDRDPLAYGWFGRLAPPGWSRNGQPSEQP